MNEYFKNLTDEQKEIFSKGRESVLNDFDSICKADAFMGFSEEEFKAVKKFFNFNNLITERTNN